MQELDRLPDVFRNMPVREQCRRLTRTGIAEMLTVRSAPETFALGYAVQVQRLQVLEIRSMGTGLASLAKISSLPTAGPLLYTRLGRLAVRSLYTLGMDSGEIVLMPARNGYGVARVRPEPWRNDSRLRELYQAGLSSAASATEKELHHAGETPLIGMDPEFLLVRLPEKRVVPASRYLDRHGEAGCDAVSRRGRTLFPVAELRPAPSPEPSRLLRHLRKAMASASRRITDRTLIWQAGGMPQRGLPLGGHLHFSGIALTGELLRVLDNYLALPIALLEDQRTHARRPRYGTLGDFRRKPHGGFEYRTLPSFLVSPLLAKGVIGFAYLIARHYRELPQRPLQQDAIHEAFYNGDKPRLYKALEPLLDDIEHLPSFQEYRHFADPFIRCLRGGEVWDETRDIRPLWGLPFPR
ncbi:putative amidoligase domain-containing protein [Paenibacillus medicaginis]|uniref:Phage phiEco32-like COOH-NH2 ligase-type 2 n=1 Tax=Paenibacillus medicaginis TaxID=1470560 RepID=A0ABV5BVU1_9BACL